MKCGPDEVDGFALCSGLTALNVSYTDRPDLQGLIPPITYLIRDAIFRPRHETSQPETSQPGTFSLNIHSLGELVDMYHKRKATNHLDKVYALLGMSSDDPRTAGLLADYNLPWEGVFRKLIQFLLSDQVSVDTWDDCAVAAIQGKGHICGEVFAVDNSDTRSDVQYITIHWKNACGQFGETLEEISRHAFQVSAQPIWTGDAVCFLRGASAPTIIRFCRDEAYSAIIRIAFPLEKTHPDRLAALRSTPIAPTDFVMIWDWDAPQPGQNSQGRDYEPFISSRGPCPRPWTESQDYFVKSIRSWNFAILINGLGKYRWAWSCFQKAVEAYAMALETRHTSPDQGAWMADEEPLREMSEMVIGEKDEDKRFYTHSPLFRAVEEGREGLVKFLLDKGATVHVVEPKEDRWNDKDNTPLLCALEKGHDSIVKLLLERRAIIPIESSGRARLSWAAENGHENVVRWLLDDGTDLDAQCGDYTDAVAAACLNGQVEIVQMLLEGGADVNAPDNIHGSALQAAVIGANDKIIQILLEKGADANIWGGEYGTALQAAVVQGHEEIVQVLLENGADANTGCGCYGRALTAATTRGYDKMVHMLLEKGADVNRECYKYCGALAAAADEGHISLVRTFLENGADVNADNEFGHALHYAASGGHDKIVQLLLEEGADVNAKAIGYRSALHAATSHGHDKVIKILLENGASY